MDVRVGLWRKLSTEELMFWTVVLEKTLQNPLDCKEIQPVHPKGNQSWIFTGRTNADAKASIFWPPDAKSQLTGKDPDARRDWRREEKGTTEDEIVGWHLWFYGPEFDAPADGEGQGGLACCRPWGHRESDRTERLKEDSKAWSRPKSRHFPHWSGHLRPSVNTSSQTGSLDPLRTVKIRQSWQGLTFVSYQLLYNRSGIYIFKIYLTWQAVDVTINMGHKSEMV